MPVRQPRPSPLGITVNIEGKFVFVGFGAGFYEETDLAVFDDIYIDLQGGDI